MPMLVLPQRLAGADGRVEVMTNGRYTVNRKSLQALYNQIRELDRLLADERTQRLQAEEDRDRFRDALMRHGMHISPCKGTAIIRAGILTYVDCTCGLHAVLGIQGKTS